MDLIERYLAAVRLLLPPAQRDDITAELRDVLLSRREEKEAELGRPLTKADDESLLKAFGNPLEVAGRYAGEQYLIGPELYQPYLLVLKIVLAVIIGSAIVTGVVSAVVDTSAPGAAVRTAIGVAWSGAWGAVGAVTVVFAVLQRPQIRARLLANWNVRDLPRPARRRRRPGWPDHVAAIVVQVIFLLWWTHVIELWPSTIPLKDGQTVNVALGPVWQGLFWPIVALSLGVIGVHALKLFGRASTRAAYGLDIAVQAGVLALVGALVRGGDWVVVTGSGLPAKALGEVLAGMDAAIVVSLAVIAIVAVCTIAYDGWRIARPAAADRA
jgi:hypothetical protein